jgi:hypothetical protein
MASSGMLRRVALVRADVSEEPGALFLRSVRRLLVAACVVPSSPIHVTLMKKAPGSSETSALTRATRRNFPEDTIVHSHRRENSNLTCGIYFVPWRNSCPSSDFATLVSVCHTAQCRHAIAHDICYVVRTLISQLFKILSQAVN